MSDHESDPVVDAAPDPEASGMSLVATTRFEGVTPSSSEPMLPVIEGRPAVAPVDDSLYTPTAYDLLAAEIMNDLDAVAAKIGKLEYPHRSTAKFMRSHVNIPRLFLETAVFIARDTPELEAIGKLDYMDGLDTLQFDRAFGPVCDRLAALTKTLRHTLAARKARLAAKASPAIAAVIWPPK
jgi:hypothetical protein